MAVQPNVTEQITLESGFISFFNTLPEKPATTIRIFDRNDYYTIHGEDALFTAKELYKTTAVVKYLGSDPNKLPSVILNKSNFEFWTRELLLVKLYRIEIYQNKTGGKYKDSWVLDKKASPGNLADFEELLFVSVDNASLVGTAAVTVNHDNGERIVGVSFIDTASHRILVSEFTDNEYFQNLDAVITQLGPSECLLPSGDHNSDLTKIQTIIEKCKVLVSRRKKSDFNNKDIVSILNRLLRFHNGVQSCILYPEIHMKESMAALAALVSFLELLNEESSLGHFNIGPFDSQKFMRLDAAAVEALQINPAPQDSNKYQHLLGVLNRCRTGPGQRLIHQWIKQPLTNLNEIEERQNIVSVFVADSVLRKTLSDDVLCKIPDFQKLAKRFITKRGNLQDCYKMYQSLQIIPQTLDLLKNVTGEHADLINVKFCNALKDLMQDFVKFHQMIEETVDLSLVDGNEFRVKAEFDDDLTELKQVLNGLEKSMDSHMTEVAKDLNLDAGKTIKLESNDKLGYFFRVTLKEEKVIRGNSHYIMIDANKVGVRFHSKELKNLNDEYVEAREQYETKQRAVVSEIVGISATYVEAIMQLSDVFAELDVLLSFAITATVAPTPYVKPKILPKGSGVIKLVSGRHPCMELQEYISFIPNDVTFSQDKKFFIITGPNMGGKSTYMRMVGVIVLLAQIGSFVPCDAATISVVDAILTRVGCEDSHLRAISTFMLEMVEMASILRTATADSLVIIDELGRGTSTYDGFGIAWAIAEKISKVLNSYCLFATHFHELTVLADEVPSVTNMHVTAMLTKDGPTFLYHVKPGVCDRSYGLHIAELVNFPTKVLEYARLKAMELEDFQTSSLVKVGGYEGEDVESACKRRAAKQEGEQIIAEFLENVKQIDLKKLTPEEVKCVVDKLKSEVYAKQNPYVMSILNKP